MKLLKKIKNYFCQHTNKKFHHIDYWERYIKYVCPDCGKKIYEDSE